MFKQLICVLLLMSYVIAPARAEQGCPYTTQIAYADGHYRAKDHGLRWQSPRVASRGVIDGFIGAVFMPGEGELVYIAGHRTTYRAPFARIDQLTRGDRVSLAMPYGRFEYVVTGHSVVDDEDLSVLRSHGRDVLALQACHPRFFATERYIVWADLAGVVARDGTVIRVPRRA